MVNQLCLLFYFPCLPVLLVESSGKKRAWVPDEKEAYIEIEIKERSGDKVVVETKDGKVRIKHSINKPTESNLGQRPGLTSVCLLWAAADSDGEGRRRPADEPAQV